MIKVIIKTLLLPFIGICICCFANAQSRLSISGSVFDEKQEIVKGATVFISGSQQITATDDKGRFAFDGLNAGTYQLVVKLMGYTAFTQNIMIRQSVANLTITLKVNPFALKEVVIGTDRDWSDKYDVFKSNFLGTTKNGRQCKILNPEVLTLKYNRHNNTLEGSSNDFLVIENKLLGYKIKYLLKAFEAHYRTGIANYDGETSFEDMDGPPELKKEWVQNRLKAYKGSLMHFLRAIYAGKDSPLKEGFIVRSVFDQTTKPWQRINARMSRVYVAQHPVGFDTLVTVIDNSFVSFKFHSELFITYGSKFAAKLNLISNYNNKAKIWLPFANDATILQLSLNESVIDSRGSYTNYHAFLISGYLGEKRVGDQLPFEYQPPNKAN